MSKIIDFKNEICEISCDFCGNNDIINSTNFEIIKEEMKDNGWIICKIKGITYYFCDEDCHKQFIEKNM